MNSQVLLSNTHIFLVLILAGCLSLLSCSPDEKSPEKASVPEVNSVESEKSSESLSRASKKTFIASPSAVIDHKNVDIDLLADLIHKEINKVKAANNLPLLSKNPILYNAATDQNNYQIRIGDLSHTQNSSKKRELGDRVQLYGGGFQTMAENVMYEGFIIRTSGSNKEIIAPTYSEQAKKMVRGWMNSPGHRKNIMNPKFDKVGTAVGYHGELAAVFATQVFGKKF